VRSGLAGAGGQNDTLAIGVPKSSRPRSARRRQTRPRVTKAYYPAKCTFSYDLADRLKSTTEGATTESYTYDGDGKRLTASTGAAAADTTKYLWDTLHLNPQVAAELQLRAVRRNPQRCPG
jgi:YD repeat-containing protein